MRSPGPKAEGVARNTCDITVQQDLKIQIVMNCLNGQAV